jgi:hypothetical protein
MQATCAKQKDYFSNRNSYLQMRKHWGRYANYSQPHERKKGDINPKRQKELISFTQSKTNIYLTLRAAVNQTHMQGQAANGMPTS